MRWNNFVYFIIESRIIIINIWRAFFCARADIPGFFLSVERFVLHHWTSRKERDWFASWLNYRWEGKYEIIKMYWIVEITRSLRIIIKRFFIKQWWLYLTPDVWRQTRVIGIFVEISITTERDVVIYWICICVWLSSLIHSVDLTFRKETIRNHFLFDISSQVTT